MQKTKKLLAIGLSCLTLISCTYFVGCKENTPAPTYECSTCLDEGIIDCPNCHVKKCDYEGYKEFCDGKGYIQKFCDNCNGKAYIDTKLCSNCRGNGYNDRGYKCSNCNGRGLVNVDCPKCKSNGYYNTSYTPNCTKCTEGLIGGIPCSDGSCKLPYAGSSKNYGYTYIDCPDCEQD